MFIIYYYYCERMSTDYVWKESYVDVANHTYYYIRHTGVAVNNAGDVMEKKIPLTTLHF